MGPENVGQPRWTWAGLGTQDQASLFLVLLILVTHEPSPPIHLADLETQLLAARTS